MDADAKPGKSDKQQKEQNSPNLGPFLPGPVHHLEINVLYDIIFSQTSISVSLSNMLML